MKQEIIIDFTHEGEMHGKTVLLFYRKFNDKKEQIEYAYMSKDDDKIYFYTQDKDIKILPKKHLREFIIDRYNEISTDLTSKSLYQKTARTVPFFRLYIVGYKVPVAIYLGFIHGLRKTLKLYKIDYHLNKTRDNDAYMNIPIILNNEKTVLSLYANDTRSQFLVNGFKIVKIQGRKFNSLDDVEVFKKIIEEEYSKKAPRDFKLFEKKIIDPVTADYLKNNKLPTNFSELLVTEMTDKLLNSPVESVSDSKNTRIRMSEAVLDTVYSHLMIAARAVEEGTKDKLFLKPDYVVRELMRSGLIHYTKSLSPLDELAQVRKVTKAGVGNPRAENISVEQRDVNQSMYGVMSPTMSHEYTKIGVVHGMAASVNFKNEYGEIQGKDADEDVEAHDILSVNELMTTPFLDKNDQTRNVMGNQQSSQYLELKNPDIQHSQTGYESLAAHISSDRFSKKSKCDGKVVEIVKDDYIKIKCDDGKETIIDIQQSRSRTKRGVYINKQYKVIANKGQKVKAGDVVAVSPSLQHGLLTPGKNAVIAVMNYKGQNFEDGFVVTESFLGKYEYSKLEKITVLLTKDTKIEYIMDQIGTYTNQGDTLIKFAHKTEFSDMMENLKENEENSDINELADQEEIFKGFKRTKNGETEYLSPGGHVVDIVVKLNSKTGIDPEVKKLYNKLIKRIEEREKICKQTYVEGSEGFLDCAYSHENSVMKKIGNHSINGVEPDGAIIEYYIETTAHGDQSSKLVIGSYGQKATVQYVIPKGKEPIAEDSGLQIDLIISPLSIFARKALGTLMSIYAGKVTYELNRQCKELAQANKPDQIYKKVKTFYKLIDKTKDNRILESFESSWDPKEAVRYLKSRDPFREPYFPFVGTPFVNEVSIADVEEVAKQLKIKLSEKVIIKEDDYTTDKPVTVGISTVLLTEHIPGSMANAVSIAKKSNLTGQGKSGSKLGLGSLSVGQYDLSSLLTSGNKTKNLIKELSVIRSDDAEAEKQFIKQIVRSGEPADLSVIPTNTSKTKKVVDSYLIAAGVEP